MQLLIFIGSVTSAAIIIRCVSSIWSSWFSGPEIPEYTPSILPYTPCTMQKGIFPRYRNPHPPRRVIAIDTESVSGPRGAPMVARVSLVRRDGKFYDRYVKPVSPVTDYRTPYSGIREKDLVNAEDFMQVRWDVARFLEDCILVGHDLKHDLNVLKLSHPAKDIRDTSEYLPFRKMIRKQIVEEEMRRKRLNMSHYDAFEMTFCEVQAMSMADKLTNPKPKLKLLARRLLGRYIQNGEHSSVEDARAAMDLYLLVEMEWESAVAFRVKDSSARKSKIGFHVVKKALALPDKERQRSPACYVVVHLIKGLETGPV